MGAAAITGAIATDTIATGGIIGAGATTAIEDGTATTIARGTGARADVSLSGRSGSVRERSRIATPIGHLMRAGRK